MDVICPFVIPHVAIAVTPEVHDAISQPTGSLEVGGDIKTEGGDVIAGNKWELEFANVPQSEIHKILWDINELELIRWIKNRI